MIRIKKPRTAPRVLQEQGKTATHKMGVEYDGSPDDYQSGKKKFSFNKIYNHPSVKEALKKAQHGKCCYCESKFEHVQFGDVEHYRPKKGYRQRKSDKLTYPGYYWLAYEWSNLVATCQLCNQRFKKNLFPLRDETSRARSHHDDITLEEPLLLNPAEIDPERYIYFRRMRAYAVKNNPIGIATIEILQLNRKELLNRRLEKFTLIKELYTAKKAFIPETEQDWIRYTRLEKLLARTLHDHAEYAGMIRSYFNTSST